jgi:predicted DNA-binding transcriptional regulator AlpA
MTRTRTAEATGSAVRLEPEVDCVVSETQAAAILGYSKDTRRRQFKAGRSPVRVRLSDRRIGYRLSAIYRFLEECTERRANSGST